MSHRSRLRRKIRQYSEVKNQLNLIVAKLSKSHQLMDNSSDKIKNRYQINDDYPPIARRADNLSKNIVITKQNLTTKVIPAIEREIDNLYHELASLDDDE